MRTRRIFMAAALIAGLAWAMSATEGRAQDVLITTEGDVMNVYVDDISSTMVYYRLESDTEAALQRMEKAKVYMIKRADGTKYDLGTPASTSAPASATPSIETPAQAVALSEEVSEEAQATNRRRIEAINNAYPECTDDKKGDADYVFCSFAVTEDSQLENDEVSLDWQWGYADFYTNHKNPLFAYAYMHHDQAVRVTVKNKTNRTLYIDLGNSFFIRGEQAAAYYVPTATSTSSTSGSGASVNAGAVASALGVGGGIGKLANGINVGGGSSSTTTSVTYSQRVIAVPPLSSTELDYQILFDGYKPIGMSVIHYDKYRPFFPAYIFMNERKKKYNVQVGEAHYYTQGIAPIQFSVMVSYSYTEDCSEIKSLRVTAYPKQLLGFNRNSWNGKTYIDYHDAWGFFAEQNYYRYGKNSLSFPLP